MNDAKLIADFTRTAEVDGEIHLQVAVVDWPDPGSPALVWKTFRHWKKPPTPERLAAAQQNALMSRQCFRVCQHCGQRNNIGHMHDDAICQTCAESHLAAVY